MRIIESNAEIATPAVMKPFVKSVFSDVCKAAANDAAHPAHVDGSTRRAMAQFIVVEINQLFILLTLSSVIHVGVCVRAASIAAIVFGPTTPSGSRA